MQRRRLHIRRIARRPRILGLITLLATTVVTVAGCAGTRADHTGATSDGYFVEAPVFGTSVHVVEAGDPTHPPVLLVHGLGQRASRDWRTVIDALDGRYHVLAPDLPGFGRSPAPDTGRLSPENYARLLDWLLKRKSLENVRLVGHSMGGAIALYYASAHPANVHNVTLVDVSGILHKVAFVKAMIDPPLDLSALPAPLERPLRSIMGAVRSSIFELTDLPSARGLVPDRPTLNAALALINTDFSRVLARFSLPSTIIWGRQDTIAPLRTAHLLHGRLPGSRLHWIPNAGHVPMTDDPAAFRSALALALEYTGGEGFAPEHMGARMGDYACRGDTGGTISGSFDQITMRGCVGVELVNVSARHIDIRDSVVTLRDVRVDADKSNVGIVIQGSRVMATDLRAAGSPAVLVGASQFDAAGAIFRADAAAVVVKEPSEFILSVSAMRSGVYTGYLHGAADAAHSNLGALQEIRSRFTDLLPAPAEAGS